MLWYNIIYYTIMLYYIILYYIILYYTAAAGALAHAREARGGVPRAGAARQVIRLYNIV